MLLALSELLIAGPVLHVFDGGFSNPRRLVAEAVGAVVALSPAADLVAAFVLRGRRWAR
ncbi:MAG: hypothetical protein ACRDWY_07955 [Actinomycetes bacterium]